MSIRLSTVGVVHSDLTCSDNVALVLDGSRSEQRVPMSSTCLHIESTRYHQNLCSSNNIFPVKFWVSQIIGLIHHKAYVLLLKVQGTQSVMPQDQGQFSLALYISIPIWTGLPTSDFDNNWLLYGWGQCHRDGVCDILALCCLLHQWSSVCLNVQMRGKLTLLYLFFGLCSHYSAKPPSESQTLLSKANCLYFLRVGPLRGSAILIDSS